MRALPSGFAEDGGFAGAVDAGRTARGAVSRGPVAVRRVVTGDEPDFDLRAGADCAGANSVSAETFPGGSGCPRVAGKVRERDLFYGSGAGGRVESRGNSAVRYVEVVGSKERFLAPQTSLGMTNNDS